MIDSGTPERLRPFVEAVVRQVAAAGGEAEDAWDEVRWCAALAASGDAAGIVDTLLADVPLLSACYQNADLLPVDDDGAAAILAQAVLEATHRLAG
ncbi:MAG: hypothetical protein ACK53W_05230 [Gemmatimonadota bacterium]|jgi:hypothetical protein